MTDEGLVIVYITATEISTTTTLIHSSHYHRYFFVSSITLTTKAVVITAEAVATSPMKLKLLIRVM